jgi:regulatory protein
VEELRGRLLRKGFSPEEVEGCLTWLEDRTLLDDEAFSRSLVRDRLRFSPRAPRMLEHELRRRGIALPVAEEAVRGVMAEEGKTEERLAREAGSSWVRRQGRGAAADLVREGFSPGRQRARRRLYGFLTRRGFSGAAARAWLEAAMKEARILMYSID